jgi:hypothetical protein
MELACARVSDGCYEDFLTFWRRHNGSLKHLNLRCLKLSRESRHVEAPDSWPATLETMSRTPIELFFMKIRGLSSPDLDPTKQVAVFSEKRGPCGCKECRKTLWQDGNQNVGNKDETGQWPEPRMIRVHEQYDTAFQ